MKCFNKEIEWNYSYLKKLRLCFTTPQRKLKDVKFAFREPGRRPQKPRGRRIEGDSDDEADLDQLLGEASPKFRVYFKVQQQADVVVFEVSDFKTQISNTPMTVFAERMAEFSRGKSREVEELRRERDSER